MKQAVATHETARALQMQEEVAGERTFGAGRARSKKRLVS